MGTGTTLSLQIECSHYTFVTPGCYRCSGLLLESYAACLSAKCIRISNGILPLPPCGKTKRPACFLRIPSQYFACILNKRAAYLRANPGTSILSLLSVGARMAPAVATYAPRDPSHTVLYTVIAEYLETFLASCNDDPEATGLPAYVQREFYDYLRCGILAHGFLRLGCDTCHKELLVPFSCQRRGFCPSCAGRRMAQMAAHLVEQVIPWVPTRQWVVSVPIPLRYWTASSQDLTAKVHTIIRTTIAQYYVNQAVQGGAERHKAHPGSVTFIQRFGSALNPDWLTHLKSCILYAVSWNTKAKRVWQSC